MILPIRLHVLPAFCCLTLFLSGAVGCARGPNPILSPQESFLSIVNEYELFQGVDIYRNPFPHDLTGQNVARATLVRLANYEDLYPGRFAPEIEMIRGRLFADLGDYKASRSHFLHCADFDTSLSAEAREAAGIAGKFNSILSRAINQTNLESHLADRERQIADFQALAGQYRGTRWGTLARIEEENLEMARAELLDANQFAIPGGAQRAQQAFEELVRDHPDSRRALSHALRLARFHLDQARLMVRLQDPERGNFDWSGFSSHLEIALDILHRVSQADGRPEKVLAQHELDEALAFYDLIRRESR